MITTRLASTTRHFEGILRLQRKYHVSTLPPDAQDREGFVYAQHTVPLLRMMSTELPQAVAVTTDDEVVGYCLALATSLRHEVPLLLPMFEQFNRSTWRGRPLSEVRYFAGGQVCVDRAHRGRGLLARLYEQLRVAAPSAYEVCVTEIAIRNAVSLRAHRRMGFEEISRYADGGEDWVVVAWALA
jgi:GNAT superfamily N-acetyltransferase